jgi:hypothetical protein
VNWPWQRHRQVAAERGEAEARAEQVQRQVTEPLRAMRHYDYLTAAVRQEMKRQISQGRQ